MNKLQKIYINKPGDESAVIYVRCDENLMTEVNSTNGDIFNLVNAKDTMNQTVITLKNEMNKVRDVLKCAYDSINGEEFAPDQLEISTGLELSSSVGAILVSGDMKASITVKAVWKK